MFRGLIEPDNSPEASLRRGEAAPGVEAGAALQQQAQPIQSVPATGNTASGRHARHPELRDMKLDPYGLADEPAHTAGDDYQR